MGRPSVKRFQMKKVHGNRIIRRTVVKSKSITNLRKGRTLRPMRSLKKAR